MSNEGMQVAQATNDPKQGCHSGDDVLTATQMHLRLIFASKRYPLLVAFLRTARIASSKMNK